MKKLSMAEWEKQYIVEPVSRFDQINTMTRRVYADQTIKELLNSLSAPVTYFDKPGFKQKEYALRWAPRYLHAQIAELNNSKANPSHLSLQINKIINESKGALSYVPGLIKDKLVESPEDSAINIKKVATFYGSDLVGITSLDKRWIYSYTCERNESGNSFTYDKHEIPEEFKYAIVLAFKVDYQIQKYVKTYIAGAAHDAASTRMVVTSALLTRFIQNLGYKAIDCNIDDVVISVPLAMQAGLGQLGRLGMLITPQFGPRVRLSVVLTDLPLKTDSPVDFGVTEFCSICKKCAKMCPSQSISFNDRTTKPVNISNSSGGLKWPQNAETCRIRAVTHKYPCATCISVCPYNKPDTTFHKTVRWFTDHVRWGDKFYSRMDDFFRYGKDEKPDKFWVRWNPTKDK